MALTITLMIELDAPIPEIEVAITRGISLTNNGDAWSGEDITTHVENETQRGAKLVHLLFGFYPTRRIVFGISKFELRERSVVSALECILRILGLGCGDAIITYEDKIIMQRRSGSLIINESVSDFWLESFLNVISVPYTRERISPSTL